MKTGRGIVIKYWPTQRQKRFKPFSRHLLQRLCVFVPIILGVVCAGFQASFSHSAETRKGRNRPEDSPIVVAQIPPDERGGRAYRLVYFVKAPIQSYWKFKTDFDNNFLVENKYFTDHKFISQNGNTVITETKYANGPDKYFRWRTTLFPETGRLDFVLLNPEDCGQKFHYGHIQLEAVGQGTRVTQVAYFDFFGAALWAGFPWRGGMRYFLTYTAQWEQETFLRLKGRYRIESSE